MKIGVISDIHENFHNLILSLNEMERQDVEYIICLGDLMNAGIAKILSIQNIPSFLIWGNNDGEKVDIVKASYRENSNLEVSLNTYDFLHFGGRSIFICHYDDLAEPMALSKKYDAVFYGHNHLKKIEKIGDCWVVNPGELCAQKTGVSTFAIYDTSSNDVELIELEGSISLKSQLVDDYMNTHKDKLDFRSKASFKTGHNE